MEPSGRNRKLLFLSFGCGTYGPLVKYPMNCIDSLKGRFCAVLQFYLEPPVPVLKTEIRTSAGSQSQHQNRRVELPIRVSALSSNWLRTIRIVTNNSILPKGRLHKSSLMD
jgi:hypothetical protein